MRGLGFEGLGIKVNGSEIGVSGVGLGVKRSWGLGRGWCDWFQDLKSEPQLLHPEP